MRRIESLPLRVAFGLAAFAILTLTAQRPTFAAVETTLWNFGGAGDGWGPRGGTLLRDSSGNLYGTTALGGVHDGPSKLGDGTVFKLTPPSTAGGPWTEAVLWSFGHGSDGIEPLSNVIMDASGNLYGTTLIGGAEPSGLPGGGTVFELMPPSASGASWTESVLCTFSGGPVGRYPEGGLVMDPKGNLYGTTFKGGLYNSAPNSGTVFRLAPPSNSGGTWTESVLWSFGNGIDGSAPEAGLLMDRKGNFYGTTTSGGAYGEGTVFELTRPTGGQKWTESVLWSFGSGIDGAFPTADLIMDRNGNLYSTTLYGGVYGGVYGGYRGGTVFELSPPTISGGNWTESVLWDFGNGTDGVNLEGNVVMDPHGHLYGTTYGGGAVGLIGGTAFELTPPTISGDNWSESILWSFGGGNTGTGPWAGLVFDPQGHLYGTTAMGAGTVFELSNLGG